MPPYSVAQMRRSFACSPRQHPTTRSLTRLRASLLASPPARRFTLSTHERVQEPSWRRIVDWVQVEGGWVDPRLELREDTPCGSRGVIATSSITSEDLQQHPLIAVPLTCYLTSLDADQLLQQSSSNTLQQKSWWQSIMPLQVESQPPLPVPARLALLLAHERGKGRVSRWWPYIATLPEQPPNAWLLSPGDLRAALQDLGPGYADWEEDVKKARVAMEQLAARCCRQYGQHLEVDEAVVLWALGQVMSRAFGTAECMALAPVIDLLNHREGSSKPQPLQEDASEEQQEAEQQEILKRCSDAAVDTSQRSAHHPANASDLVAQGGGDADAPTLWYVSSTRFGTPLPLGAGDELCISYVGGKGGSIRAAALEAFLNFGFVPQELRL